MEMWNTSAPMPSDFIYLSFTSPCFLASTRIRCRVWVLYGVRFHRSTRTTPSCSDQTRDQLRWSSFAGPLRLDSADGSENWGRCDRVGRFAVPIEHGVSGRCMEGLWGKNDVNYEDWVIRLFAVILSCLFSFSVFIYFILSLPNSITLFYSMYRIVRGLSKVVDSVPKTRAVKTMEPILRKEVSLPSVRFFATSSKKLETIVASSRKGRAGAFFGGTAVTLGGLAFAGLFGYPSDPRSSKDMRELRSRMEAIRKNYPNMRSFPVGTEN